MENTSIRLDTSNENISYTNNNQNNPRKRTAALTAFKPPAYYRNKETDHESNKEHTVNKETPETNVHEENMTEEHSKEIGHRTGARQRTSRRITEKNNGNPSRK